MTPLRLYILDDAATMEYQRLDLMSKILDPWTRGTARASVSGPAGTARSWVAATGAYDLVTCRAVLHQIAEHARPCSSTWPPR